MAFTALDAQNKADDIVGKWLAEQLGKDPSTVSKWCSNKMQPSLEMLVNIAKILDVDARELIVITKQ